MEQKPYPKEIQKKLYILALRIAERLENERSNT